MFSSTIKPYKFVNPSLITSGSRQGAAIIAGGKQITGGSMSSIKSARSVLLSVNRIGASVESLGKVQKQILTIIQTDNQYLVSSGQFAKRKEQYRKDQQSEDKQESLGKKSSVSTNVEKEGKKEVSKNLGWLEEFFKPFESIVTFAARALITQGILKWIADPKNGKNIQSFVNSAAKIFGFIYNVAYKSIDNFLTGVSSVFGTGDKQGFDRFKQVLGGLGQILIGIAGFKALGYLLNPFSLLGDVLNTLDLLKSDGGADVDTSGKTKPTSGKTKPTSGKPSAGGAAGKAASRSSGKFLGKAVGKIFRRIPIIGPLIDFAVRTLIFKEPIARSAVIAIGSGIGAGIGAAVGSAILPVAGTAAGGIVGGIIGDWLSSKLYDWIAPPALAEGGLVTKPTQALIGEKGPEAVIPLAKLSTAMSGNIAATLVSSVNSSFERMGSSGEIAKQLLSGDINKAKQLFGLGNVSAAAGGDSLSKSVVKSKTNLQNKLKESEDVELKYIGERNPTFNVGKTNNTMDNLRGALANVLGVFALLTTKDFSAGGGGGASAGGAPSGGVSGGATGDWAALLDLIAGKESGGNYEAMYPSTTLNGATKMTIAEVARRATGAVGKYQQLPEYLVSRAKAAGLNPDKDLYSPANQDLIVSKVNIEQNRGGSRWLSGQMSDEAFMDGLAYEFASLPDAYGRFKYKGQSSSMKPSTIRDALSKVKQSNVKKAQGGTVPPPGVGRNVNQIVQGTKPPKDKSELSRLKGEAIGGMVKFATGGKYENGKLPSSALEDVGRGHKLRKGEVAQSFKSMVGAAKKDGVDLVSDITGSYRDYDGQVYMFNTKPRGMAAKPGTSKHGWGLALDIGAAKSQNWINNKGSAYGWGLPDWAKGGFEPWHFEKLNASSMTPSTDSTSSPSASQEVEEDPLKALVNLVDVFDKLNSALGLKPVQTEKPPAPAVLPPAPKISPSKPNVSGAQLSQSSQSSQITKTIEDSPSVLVAPIPLNIGSNQTIIYESPQVIRSQNPITNGF